MVNMKLDPKAQQEMARPSSVATDAPIYPYGLSITLDNDSIEKLKLGIPKVGQTLKLEAKVQVTGCSSHKTAGNESYTSVTLQITDMDLEGLRAKKPIADRLYGTEE